jgi:hypothetical protein
MSLKVYYSKKMLLTNPKSKSAKLSHDQLYADLHQIIDKMNAICNNNFVSTTKSKDLFKEALNLLKSLDDLDVKIKILRVH